MENLYAARTGAASAAGEDGMAPGGLSRRGFCAAFAAFSASAGALAQGGPWPNRPIRLIVAGGPGASTDAVARALAVPLGERLKVPVIVEYKAGANGAVAGVAVAKSAADGYALLITPSDSQVLGPLINADLPYNAEKDFIPVAKVAELNLVISVNPKIPVTSIRELVAHAKAHPGKLTFSSSGVGGVQHLTVEMLKQRAGLDLLHVAYKSGAESANALVSGQVDVFAGSPTLLAELHKGGKVRVLAIAKESRSSLLPEVPTMAEAGIPRFVSASWYGIFAPTGVPDAVVARLSENIVAVCNTPEYRQRMEAVGIDGTPIGRENMGKYVASEWVHWRQLLEGAGVKTVPART